jgi:cytochrome P450
LDSTGEDDGTEVNSKYLIDESVLFMFVGTDTTAYALSFAVYYLINNPPVLQKLKAELKEAENYVKASDWP